MFIKKSKKLLKKINVIILSNNLNELHYVKEILENTPIKNLVLKKIYENKFNLNTEYTSLWNQNFKQTVNLLNIHKINYTLIKYINLPEIYMKDIDLLIEKKDDIRKLILELRKLNFNIYTKNEFKTVDKYLAFGFFNNRLKVEIDIYPKPSWWMIRYASDQQITLNKTSKIINGQTVFIPSPTHELYIIATHSFWHGTITLAEVTYIYYIIKNNNIKWDDLIELAERYHLKHAVYIYLRLVKEIFTLQHIKNDDLNKTLTYFSTNYLCYSIWNALKKSNNNFPLNISFIYKIISALDEIFRGLGKGKLFYGEFESYLTALLFGRRKG